MQLYKITVVPLDVPFVLMAVKNIAMVLKPDQIDHVNGDSIADYDIGHYSRMSISCIPCTEIHYSNSSKVHYIKSDASVYGYLDTLLYYVDGNGRMRQSAVSTEALSKIGVFTKVYPNNDTISEPEKMDSMEVTKDTLIELTKLNLENSIKTKDSVAANNWLQILIQLTTKVDF